MSWYDDDNFDLKIIGDGTDRSDHQATIAMSVYIGDGQTVTISLTKSDLLMIRRDVNRTLKQLNERTRR